MLDQAITEFFESQKAAWLLENAKKLDGEALDQKKTECDAIFDISTWLTENAPKAASRAITTHPSKFSHPDTGVGKTNVKKGTYVTPTIFKGEHRSDGLLRTGNVATEDVDSVGDAGALKIEAFLKVKVNCDGRLLVDHLLEDSHIANALYDCAKIDKEWLRESLLAGVSKATEDTVSTNSRIKQVYFPVDDDYHQLSVLTNSSLVFELRKRLDAMRFGDELKAKRDLKKKGEFSEQSFSEIYGLTTIGYGGTKPQNISVLNNQNGGKAYLLASVPPNLTVRDVRFPKNNFFAESLNSYHFKELFEYLHKVMSIPLGGDMSRQKLLTARDNSIKALVLKVMDVVYTLRNVSAEQYREGSGLPAAQVVWLCAAKAEEREANDVWLAEIIHECTRWLNNTYAKVLGDKKIPLGNEEFTEIKRLIEMWVADNKEFLR